MHCGLLNANNVHDKSGSIINAHFTRKCYLYGLMVEKLVLNFYIDPSIRLNQWLLETNTDKYSVTLVRICGCSEQLEIYGSSCNTLYSVFGEYVMMSPSERCPTIPLLSLTIRPAACSFVMAGKTRVL